jgi:hypothetical protein
MNIARPFFCRIALQATDGNHRRLKQVYFATVSFSVLEPNLLHEAFTSRTSPGATSTG